MTQLTDWQRLSPLALVFIVLNGLQKQVRENLFLFAGAGAGAAFTDWLGLREFGLLLAGFLLLSVLGALIYHRRFRFCLEDDAIRVRRGLIEQKELRVRFARVQNIQLGQPFYFRPFGLVRFSLQTPGAAEKEIELPGIARELAETMRDRISAARAQPGETAPETQPLAASSDELFTAGSLRLFLHGLSSNQVWVIAGLFFYLFGNLLDRFGDRVDRLVEEASSSAVTFSWPLALGLLAGALMVLFTLSGLLALLRFHGYRLFRRQDRLVAVGGLLDRREQTVRTRKLTGLLLRQSAVARLLGCWSLYLRQTRSGDQELESGRSVFLVPGLRHADLGLTDTLLPGSHWPPRLNPISPRFRVFAWSRLLLMLVLALLVVRLLFGPDHWTLLGLATLATLGLPLLQLRFRRWGWALQGSIFWVRSGLLGQRLDAFDLRQVQQARVMASPYQRRHHLASLELMLPQGAVSVPFLSEQQAAALANQAVFAAETARWHRV